MKSKTPVGSSAALLIQSITGPNSGRFQAATHQRGYRINWLYPSYYRDLR
jgi:hypothetical protein